MTLGSLMLFDSAEEWARLSLKVVIPSVIVFASFFVLCVWLVLKAQRRSVTTGKGAMIGETGRVVEPIPGGGGKGKVVFHGEVWDAVAEIPVDKGDTIEVLAIEGRVARVRPA